MSDWYVLDLNDRPVRVPFDDVLSGAVKPLEGNRHVGKSRAWFSQIYVSTVFLGLDHQYGDGPPLLWETMIFGGLLDQECWRYSSKEKAERGHRKAVLLAWVSPVYGLWVKASRFVRWRLLGRFRRWRNNQ